MARWHVAAADNRSRASSAKRLFASDTVVEIKQAASMEWAGKGRF
jgi:hypothetical protein